MTIADRALEELALDEARLQRELVEMRKDLEWVKEIVRLAVSQLHDATKTIQRQQRTIQRFMGIDPARDVDGE